MWIYSFFACGVLFFFCSANFSVDYFGWSSTMDQGGFSYLTDEDALESMSSLLIGV